MVNNCQQAIVDGGSRLVGDMAATDGRLVGDQHDPVGTIANRRQRHDGLREYLHVGPRAHVIAAILDNDPVAVEENSGLLHLF